MTSFGFLGDLLGFLGEIWKVLQRGMLGALHCSYIGYWVHTLQYSPHAENCIIWTTQRLNNMRQFQIAYIAKVQLRFPAIWKWRFFLCLSTLVPCRNCKNNTAYMSIKGWITSSNLKLTFPKLSLHSLPQKQHIKWPSCPINIQQKTLSEFKSLVFSNVLWVATGKVIKGKVHVLSD